MADEDNRRTELEDYYRNLPPERRRQRIILEPAFRDAYNEISRAHQVVQVPKYFWDNWAPVLGPVATALYVRLRLYCYYNPQTGERRDWCWPKQQTLAAQVGIKDPKTLRKALLLLESQGFIRREPQYRQSSRGGAIERTSDKYLVYFEIPLADGDAVELLLRQSVEVPGFGASSRTGESSSYGETPVENGPRIGKESLHGAGEKVPSRKNYLEEVLDERNVGLHTQGQVVTGQRTDVWATGPTAVGEALRNRFKQRPAPKRAHLADVLPQITTSPEKRDELLRVEDLAGQMLEQLGDSRSAPFYRLVARNLLAGG